MMFDVSSRASYKSWGILPITRATGHWVRLSVISYTLYQIVADTCGNMKNRFYSLHYVLLWRLYYAFGDVCHLVVLHFLVIEFFLRPHQEFEQVCQVWRRFAVLHLKNGSIEFTRNLQETTEQRLVVTWKTFNKIAIQNKLQTASGWGSHWFIESEDSNCHVAEI